MGNILEKFRLWVRRALRYPVPSSDASVLWSTFGRVAPASQAKLVEYYRTLGWVYACASCNARSAAVVPIRLYAVSRRGEARPRTEIYKPRPVLQKTWDRLVRLPYCARALSQASHLEELTSHPLLDLLSRANDVMDGTYLRMIFILYQQLVGVSYLLEMRENENSPPIALWPLQAHKVRVIPGKEQFIVGYRYGDGASAEVFPQRDVIRMAAPNPEDPYYGLGPMQAAVKIAEQYVNMLDYQNDLLANDARPDFAIIPEGPLDETSVKILRAEWERLHRGKGRAGKPMIMPGIKELKTLGFAPRDLAFLQGRKYTRDEILAIFGVHPSMLLTEDVNLANAVIGRRTYQETTVSALLVMQDSALNADLVPEYDDSGRLLLASDDPVSEDLDADHRRTIEHVNAGIMSRNEARAKFGMPAVDGADSLLVPVSLMPIADTRERRAVSGGRIVLATALYDAPVRRVDDVTTMTAQERAVADKLSTLFGAMFREIDAMIAGVRTSGIVKIDPMRIAVGIDGWEGRFLSELGNGIFVAIHSGASRAIELPAIAAAFDLSNPAVQEALRVRAANITRKFVGQTLRTTKRIISEAIDEGIAAGEGVDAIRARVREIGEHMRTYQAETIARTEVRRAQEHGTLYAWRESGVVEARRWTIAPGACPFCRALDGKIIRIHENWAELGDVIEVEGGNDGDGGRLVIDYETVETPPLHPRCVCTEQPILLERYRR